MPCPLQLPWHGDICRQRDAAARLARHAEHSRERRASLQVRRGGRRQSVALARPRGPPRASARAALCFTSSSGRSESGRPSSASPKETKRCWPSASCATLMNHGSGLAPLSAKLARLCVCPLVGSNSIYF